MFLASLPQLQKLYRPPSDPAARIGDSITWTPQVRAQAGLQALQRYVEQLEMDLDSKEGRRAARFQQVTSVCGRKMSLLLRRVLCKRTGHALESLFEHIFECGAVACSGVVET